MPQDKDFDSLDIVVRDKSVIPAPKAEEIQKWSHERLAEDAKDIYSDLTKAVRRHLKIIVDDEGHESLPSIKVMELAADMLKLREQGGGININQNFGGNTTIHNNGPSVSFEDIVRRQQARDNPTEIIEAEILDEKPEEASQSRESDEGVQEGRTPERVKKGSSRKKS